MLGYSKELSKRLKEEEKRYSFFQTKHVCGNADYDKFVQISLSGEDISLRVHEDNREGESYYSVIPSVRVKPIIYPNCKR